MLYRDVHVCRRTAGGSKIEVVYSMWIVWFGMAKNKWVEGRKATVNVCFGSGVSLSDRTTAIQGDCRLCVPT